MESLPEYFLLPSSPLKLLLFIFIYLPTKITYFKCEFGSVSERSKSKPTSTCHPPSMFLSLSLCSEEPNDLIYNQTNEKKKKKKKCPQLGKTRGRPPPKGRRWWCRVLIPMAAAVMASPPPWQTSAAAFPTPTSGRRPTSSCWASAVPPPGRHSPSFPSRCRRRRSRCPRPRLPSPTSR